MFFSFIPLSHGLLICCLFQNYFSINSSDGSVSILHSADREVAQEYNIQITVTDLNAYNPNPQTATSKSWCLVSNVLFCIVSSICMHTFPVQYLNQEKDLYRLRLLSNPLIHMYIPLCAKPRESCFMYILQNCFHY